jgi:hypothetical protein
VIVAGIDDHVGARRHVTRGAADLVLSWQSSVRQWGVDGARQIIWPIALEERTIVAIPLTDGSRLAHKLRIVDANVNLFFAILFPLRDEADLVEGSAPDLGRSISIGGANRARHDFPRRARGRRPTP